MLLSLKEIKRKKNFKYSKLCFLELIRHRLSEKWEKPFEAPGADAPHSLQDYLRNLIPFIPSIG
jgi:hypothetical protein